MTRDEKLLLVRMLGGGRLLEVGDHKKALSRLIRGGLVVAGRWKSSPRFGRNRHELTPRGRAVAAMYAQTTEPSFYRLEWWRGENRRGSLRPRKDSYGYRIYGARR